MEFICSQCPRRCGALRRAEDGDGFCRMGALPRLARAALHHWEEPCISGTRGSGTVFFSGCALGCVFCQNYSVSHDGFGRMVSVSRLREIFDGLVAQGAHNINLVNPTHWAHACIEALEIAPRLPVPVVYNTGGYDSTETLRRLEGLVDIYLPDLKYIDSGLSARYSGAGDYFEHASRAILEMCRQTGPAQYDGEGLLRRGVMVRHLILPGHVSESLRVLAWCREHLPPGVPLSVMSQYTPCGEARDMPPLNRRLKRREYDRVVDFLCDSGQTDGYVQELSSAKEEYIPPFDLEGV